MRRAELLARSGSVVEGRACTVASVAEARARRFVARGRLAAGTRHFQPDDPRLPELRKQLQAARREETHAQVLDHVPGPLTADQVDAIAELLWPRLADTRGGVR
jgi:hypothetical protein